MNNTLFPLLSYVCAAISGIFLAGGFAVLRMGGDK